MSVNPYYQPFFKQNNREVRIPSLSQGIHNRPHELGNREYFGKWDDTEKAEINPSSLANLPVELPIIPDGYQNGETLIWNEKKQAFEVNKKNIIVRATTTEDLTRYMTKLAEPYNQVTDGNIQFKPRHTFNYQRRQVNPTLSLDSQQNSGNDKAYGYDIITTYGKWKPDFVDKAIEQNLQPLGFTVDGVSLGIGDLILVKDTEYIAIDRDTIVYDELVVEDSYITDIFPNQELDEQNKPEFYNFFSKSVALNNPDSQAQGVYRVLANGKDEQSLPFFDPTKPNLQGELADYERIVLERIYLTDDSSIANEGGNIKIWTDEGFTNAKKAFSFRYKTDVYGSYRETVKNIDAYDGVPFNYVSNKKIEEVDAKTFEEFQQTSNSSDDIIPRKHFASDLEITSEAGDLPLVFILTNYSTPLSLQYNINEAQSNIDAGGVVITKKNTSDTEYDDLDYPKAQLHITQLGARPAGNVRLDILPNVPKAIEAVDSKIRILSLSRLMGSPGLIGNNTITTTIESGKGKEILQFVNTRLPATAFFVFLNDDLSIGDAKTGWRPIDGDGTEEKWKLKELNMYDFRVPNINNSNQDVRVDAWVLELNDTASNTVGTHNVAFQLHNISESQPTEIAINAENDYVVDTNNGFANKTIVKTFVYNALSNNLNIAAKGFNYIGSDLTRGFDFIDSRPVIENFHEDENSNVLTELAQLSFNQKDDIPFAYDFLNFDIVNSNTYESVNSETELGIKKLRAADEYYSTGDFNQDGDTYTLGSKPMKERMESLETGLKYQNEYKGVDARVDFLRRLALASIAKRYAIRVDFITDFQGSKNEGAKTLYKSYSKFPEILYNNIEKPIDPVPLPTNYEYEGTTLDIDEVDYYAAGNPKYDFGLVEHPFEIVKVDGKTYLQNTYRLPQFSYEVPDIVTNINDLDEEMLQNAPQYMNSSSVDSYVVRIPNEFKKLLQSYSGIVRISAKNLFPPVNKITKDDFQGLPNENTLDNTIVDTRTRLNKNQGSGLVLVGAKLSQSLNPNSIKPNLSQPLNPTWQFNPTVFSCKTDGIIGYNCGDITVLPP